MIEKIVKYSLRHKLIILLGTLAVFVFGIWSVTQLPIGAVPDVTNNQVQVITVSRNLATTEIEQFITYPIELEMANLPGVTEIRSISKFGLSVVTVVFEDKMGTWLPRQLIAEKLKNAEEIIPEGFGTPEAGPVSTGLGEIYQYIVETEPGYEDQYSLTEIRTIQDWIIKRQLSGIEGVVEINTWGGFLKQYEVAVNPERLRALDISVTEVYDALRKNNNVAGGGYIEKTNQAYFVRGEGLVENIEDIKNIVVKNIEGTPVLISNIAEVKIGHATRFGAITANGKGETVLGQVMMLKGANPKATIDRVNERIKIVQKSLPEGIKITPVVDRSELIGRTTFTIAENLILGFLIVFFVVVLLLGNFRSGLVVASVIPLSLMFAVSLMNIFGVDANLMSLGAIDFGIIIDGAVVIVEFTAFNISRQLNRISVAKGLEKQTIIDRITFESSSSMMRSAVFGQLIIIIVFIPIMSLSGVEGKMFIPMALVFTFALLGTMLLGFTYVPVMSSLFLKPSKQSSKNISVRLISSLQKAYLPSIKWALAHKKAVLGISVVLLLGAGVIFARMGGEFVPTLDEGDMVIQPVLKTGTSLSETIEIITEMEKILKEFPEVKQVVSRIGAAEVPTDPMSMEESDVIVTLKPKREWVTADTKEELANEFKKALSILPGFEYEFTQPIEMRFNELITGVRADLAIKIYGGDLDVLYKIGNKIARAIENVDGASDITAEKIAGLPQMSVKYNRAKIAKYGLNVEDLNTVITTGFAGKSTGSIFEGEQQYDIVLRYGEAQRNSLTDLQRASIVLPDGRSMPLSEFAEIKLSEGPAGISRDNTRRRMVVGVNVRGRDLESVVQDVQKIVDEQIELPPGYSISYGGQFENLRKARNRLLVAVPVALFLIFVLLHFAFGSLREALMIFTAIPLATVGGIILLYLRDMPFSISAGVGFIALFGVAVLNGIVLIEHFKALKQEGITDRTQRVIQGASERLRPVLLTAGAAAMGFLPMAVSVSAGAEVQRPLATVVIGGLISSTLLTMIVLPVLYAVFGKDVKKTKNRLSPTLVLIPLFLLISPALSAQSDTLSAEQAVNTALENNLNLSAEKARSEKLRQMKKSAFDFDKTYFYYNYDENNVAENGLPLKIWGINQSFAFPTAYAAQKQVYQSELDLANSRLKLKKQAITRQTLQLYWELIFLKNKGRLWQEMSVRYKQIAEDTKKARELGQTAYLYELSAEARYKETNFEYRAVLREIEKKKSQLAIVMQSDSALVLPDTPVEALPYPSDSANQSAESVFRNRQAVKAAELKREQQNYLPDISLEYFRGSNNAPDAKAYNGFEVGLSVPILFGAKKARVQAARTEADIQSMRNHYMKQQISAEYKALTADLDSKKNRLDYYSSEGMQLSEQMIRQAEKSYREGEISYTDYSRLLNEAYNIRLSYLDAVYEYNRAVLDLQYYTPEIEF